MEGNKLIVKLTNEDASKVIETRIPRGLFYTIEKIRDKNIYIGIDNLHGDAWVEEFNNLRSCKRWLGY